MKSNEHGNASLSDEEAEQAKEDFFYACECAAEMLEDFAAMGLCTGPALGGALTQLIANLIAISPDKEAAMQMLSACIHNATINVSDKRSTHYPSSEIH